MGKSGVEGEVEHFEEVAFRFCEGASLAGVGRGGEEGRMRDIGCR